MAPNWWEDKKCQLRSPALAEVTKAIHCVIAAQETRRAYRELFYCAQFGSSISGAILYKEMLTQTDSSSRLFTDCLTDQGILPGVKVDEVGLMFRSPGSRVRDRQHSLPKSFHC